MSDNNRKKHVWVVDDDAGILEVTTIVLQEEGISTVAIRNEQDFFKKLETDLPALVILDILMSGTDGTTIAKRFKSDERTKNIPVLMMSADTQIEVKAKLAGASDYIKKPFDIDDLVSKVRHWMPLLFFAPHFIPTF